MRLILLASAAALVVALGGLSGPARTPADNKTEVKAAKHAQSPVPANMHDFMEGVFQAPYKRLKVLMAAEPKDNAGWKAIRSEALILAEGGNLLLLRKPVQDADEWAKYSADSRDAGADLFKAAKAKDYPAAKKAYETMLNHCNACHRKFEDGKHILSP